MRISQPPLPGSTTTTGEIERHLARYGTPILARQWLGSGQATVLDPMGSTEADQVRKQADELADILDLAQSQPVHRG